MTDPNKSDVTCKKEQDNETSFQRFIKEIDAKLKKEEKHTWMVKDPTHLNQNE